MEKPLQVCLRPEWFNLDNFFQIAETPVFLVVLDCAANAGSSGSMEVRWSHGNAEDGKQNILQKYGQQDRPLTKSNSSHIFRCLPLLP